MASPWGSWPATGPSRRQYGIYRPLVNNFAIALNKMEWGGRVTWLPVFEDDGRTLVHVGFGTLNGEIAQDELKDRARALAQRGAGHADPGDAVVDGAVFQVPGQGARGEDDYCADRNPAENVPLSFSRPFPHA